MWEYNRQNELYHHGILGQKWGVRRYQNEDGSLTSAGKQRYASESGSSSAISKKTPSDRVETSSESNKKKGVSKETAVKIAIGSAAALTLTAAAVYAAKNPDKVGKAIDAVKSFKVSDIANSPQARIGKEYIKSGFDASMIMAKKIGKGVAKGTVSTAKATGKSALKVGKYVANRSANNAKKIIKRTGDAAIDVATKAAIGGGAAYAAKKLSELTESGKISESDRKLIEAYAKAVKEQMKVSNNSGNNNSGGSGKKFNADKVHDIVGKPSNKPINKDSDSYRKLFEGLDAEQRGMVKNLVRSGYDLDQLYKLKMEGAI